MQEMIKNEFSKRIGAAEIAAILRREISDGTLGYHERLPAERVLSATKRLWSATERI